MKKTAEKNESRRKQRRYCLDVLTAAVSRDHRLTQHEALQKGTLAAGSGARRFCRAHLVVRLESAQGGTLLLRAHLLRRAEEDPAPLHGGQLVRTLPSDGCSTLGHHALRAHPCNKSNHGGMFLHEMRRPETDSDLAQRRRS